MNTIPIHSGCGMPLTKVTFERKVEAQLELEWTQEEIYTVHNSYDPADSGMTALCGACETHITEADVIEWVIAHMRYTVDWLTGGGFHADPE